MRTNEARRIQDVEPLPAESIARLRAMAEQFERNDDDVEPEPSERELEAEAEADSAEWGE